MTDIVERLNGFKSAAARSWAVEAANEIKRLRAELAGAEKRAEAETERAEYAWRNTRTIESARQELYRELEALRKQEPLGVFEDPKGDGDYRFRWFKAVPFGAKLYLAAGAQGVSDGWQLVPKIITAQMEAVYSNDSGAYQTAQALHDAMLAAAPKPEK